MTGSDTTDRIDSLTDFESLAERTDATVETPSDTGPADQFEHWREKVGLVGAGDVTEDAEAEVDDVRRFQA